MRRLMLALVVVVGAAACSGSSRAATPSASVTAPPTTAHTTTTLTVEQQVEAAYLKSWDVYAKAVRTLDPSGLGESYAPPHLDVLNKEIAQRVADRRPARVSVEHHVSVKVIDALSAAVRDEYINHSVRIDPQTGQPTESPPNDPVSATSTLKLIEGTWKVTFVVRQQS